MGVFYGVEKYYEGLLVFLSRVIEYVTYVAVFRAGNECHYALMITRPATVTEWHTELVELSFWDLLDYEIDITRKRDYLAQRAVLLRRN